MEQEKRAEALARLKTLLGIDNDERDDLLYFLIDDCESYILSYCRLCALPRQLESFIPVIAADIYRAKGYGSADAPNTVKSVTEGERSVSFDAGALTDAEIFESYRARLRPFINYRGRVPSDVKTKICGCV